MDELILSYTVLEFFCWNPYWDQYLIAKMEEDKKKYKDKKGVVKS